jgi:hypothetical protein
MNFTYDDGSLSNKDRWNTKIGFVSSTELKPTPQNHKFWYSIAKDIATNIICYY